MTANTGSLEYAQARVQARYGQRPDELAWRRLEVVREYPEILEAARTTGLRPWLTGIAPDSAVHEIEAAMRAHWRAVVDEVAGWMPSIWQPALRWCALLVDLPVLAHLLRGCEPLQWMHTDSVYRTFFTSSGAVDLRGGAYTELATVQPVRLLDDWTMLWRRRLPRIGSDVGLEHVARAFALHFEAFRSAAPLDGWPMRRALQARLRVAFRRAVLAPELAFVYLGIVSLDAERLRGELLRRAAFPGLMVA